MTSEFVFTEESNPANYLKLIASGEFDETMLEALEDFVKRQRKRLKGAYQAGVAQIAASGEKPPRSILGNAGDDDPDTKKRRGRQLGRPR